MKRIFVFCILCYIILSVSGCGKLDRKGGNEEQETTAISATETTESDDTKVSKDESVLNFDNLSMMIKCWHPMSDVEYSLLDDYMFILENGDVWTASYDGNDDPEWAEVVDKLYDCDDTVWTMLSELKCIGHLESGEIEKITNHIVNIDPESENTSLVNEKQDAIGENYYEYRFYCYIDDEAGNKSQFCVWDWGDSSGLVYETADEDAISAMDVVRDSSFYNEWLQAITEQGTYKGE